MPKQFFFQTAECFYICFRIFFFLNHPFNSKFRFGIFAKSYLKWIFGFDVFFYVRFSLFVWSLFMAGHHTFSSGIQFIYEDKVVNESVFIDGNCNIGLAFKMHVELETSINVLFRVCERLFNGLFTPLPQWNKWVALTSSFFLNFSSFVFFFFKSQFGRICFCLW